MGNVLTKADVKFDQLSLFRQLQPDETYIWYVIVGYTITTAEGEIINRDRRIGLTPTQANSAKTFLTNIYNQIKAEEGMA